MLEWYAGRGAFPPLLLLRRYLKLAIQQCRARGLLSTPIEEMGTLALPFALEAVPHSYPPPDELLEWVTDSHGE